MVDRRYGSKTSIEGKRKYDNEKIKQESGGTPSAKVPVPLSPEQEIAEIKRVRAQGHGVQKLNNSWGINNSKERKKFSQNRKKSHSQSASSISGKSMINEALTRGKFSVLKIVSSKMESLKKRLTTRAKRKVIPLIKFSLAFENCCNCI